MVTIDAVPVYLVEAADKALQLVIVLQSQESVGVSEAAERLDVARSTAHRLLSTLRYRGFAVQTADRRYRAGPALRKAGARPRSTALLVELAAPLLAQLRDEVNETVHLMVLDGRDVVFLHSEEGRQPLRIGSRAGVRLPAMLASGGKALLAALPPEDVDDRYSGELSATELAALHDDLGKVRSVGHAINRGGTEEGITAIAVAVRDDAGHPMSAVSVSLPSTRLRRQALPELTAALRRCADSISAMVG
jgi:IclR family acetate operon transcriptional repressor